MNLSQNIARIQQMQSEGARMEAILQAMRADGLSKVLSMRVLIATGVSFEEARNIVHASETWKDLREVDDVFSATVEQVIEELGDENPKGTDP